MIVLGRRSGRGVVGVVTWVALALGAGPARAAEPALGTVQPCGGTSWVAGTTNLCDGVLVYRDYVNDDYGGDTRQPFASTTGSLSQPAGDVRYPVGEESSADLVDLELRVAEDRLQVRAEMNALFKADATLLAVAIDTDADPATGGGRWGRLAVSSTGWEELVILERGDPGTNVLEGDAPLPRGSRWRVQAVTARRDGTVMNVAFRGIDEQAANSLSPNPASPTPPTAQGSWFEDRQAVALSRGDVSEFGHSVDVADLRNRRTQLAPVTPGLRERVYTSEHTLAPGEGMSYTGVKGRGTGGTVGLGFEQVFNFYGRYQPYGVYIPEGGGPYGLQMAYHGSNATITSLINQPGFQQDLGEGLHRILATPLARGPDGYGSDISERDVLDVEDDMRAAYPVDPDRVFASGYSQGGYVTFRQAMLHPERYAGFVAWVGFTGDDLNGTPAQGPAGVKAGAVGNMVEFAANLRHVPGAMIYGGADELVQVPSARAMQQAFAATDDVYEWFLHPSAEHLTFAALDQWDKEAAYSKPLRRVGEPLRVSFGYDPDLDSPQHGIRHDRAYWASQIRTRAAGRGDLDLTSRGCGGSLPRTATGTGAGEAPLPWASELRRETGRTPVAARDAIEGSLRNVASVTVDAGRTCTAGKAIAYSLVTDGPASVTFSDGRVLRIAGAGVHAGTVQAPDRLIASPAAGRRACVSRRAFPIRIRRLRGVRVRTTSVLVDGRGVRTVRGNRRSVRVVLRGLPRGTFRVRVVVRGVRRGRRVTLRDTRTYRTCVPRRPAR